LGIKVVIGKAEPYSRSTVYWSGSWFEPSPHKQSRY